MSVLGLDTSNYTTSAAIFDGQRGENAGRLLDVRPGELGLRQSDALFQHVKRLPPLLEELLGEEAGKYCRVWRAQEPYHIPRSGVLCRVPGIFRS